jgi:excinuclease ABC subunit B
VALVGIMDADKEGFLRSTRSLVQTIGRAARNSEGKVYLYAYKMTKSMQEAIDTTAERRKKQIAYNEKNGITPITINKKISGGVIDLLRKSKDKKPTNIEELKVSMKEASKSLRFEDAARIRDEIKELSKMRLMI